MMEVRVTVGPNTWRDVELPSNILDMDDHHKAKYAIEAWWRVDGYRGTWTIVLGNPYHRAEKPRWDDNIFVCYVDGGSTPVKIDFTNQLGGPW